MQSLLIDQLTDALGVGYTIERELGGGGMSRVFVAFDDALQRRVAVKVMPEQLAASVSVDRFKREILLSAGLQHPHIVGVLSAGEAGGLPFFVMPYVEGESLGARLGRAGAMSVREAVSVLKDVTRALVYAHERGVVHRDIKPHNILMAQGAATVTDFGVAKALSSSRRSGEVPKAGTLTGTGMSLGTPLYMAPEQAAADPDVDHRADVYALGITAYEMLTGRPPFSGLSPRALMAARMTEDPPAITTVRPDVPAALGDLVMRCLRREPADRPQSAAEVLAQLDDPSMVSGTFIALPVAMNASRVLKDWRFIGAAIMVLLVVAGVAFTRMISVNGSVSTTAAASAAAPALAPAAQSIVILPLVSIGSDSGNAYLADGITNELAATLGRMGGVQVVSPSRAAAMLAQGKSPSDIGKALNVSLQLEGTVQREGKRLRVTARLVGVSDGVMRWADMYERDATDLLSVQDELAHAITGAVGNAVGSQASASASAVAPSPPRTSGEAYQLFLRGKYSLGRRSAASLQQAIKYFKQAIAKDASFAPAYSGLADAQGLLPLYSDVPAEAALTSAIESADRAIQLDSTLAEAWASRGVLQTRRWKWSESEADLRRAIALDPKYAPAYQWLGEMLLVTGRTSESVQALQQAVQIDPASPVVLGSLGLSLALAGRTSDAIASGEKAVALDPSIPVTRMLLGAVYLYAKRPAEAIAPLEGALAIDPTSRTILGLLGYAYGKTENATGLRRIQARAESMPVGPGSDVALARIAISTGDTATAVMRMEKAASVGDPFFANEVATSPIFDALRSNARYQTLLKRIGVVR